MKRPDFTFDDLLDSIPMPNKAVTEEETTLHGLVLHVPLRRNWFLRAVHVLNPMRDKKTIRLDRLGMEVWYACNGQRTMEQIIERFSKKYQISFHEARVSVVQFMRMLTQNSLIAIIGPMRKGPNS